MVCEYVNYLDPPDRNWSGLGFARFVQEKVIEPLSKNGYELTSTVHSCVWDFRKGNIFLSLEYIHNDGGFCLIVDKRENGDEIYLDFQKYTQLVQAR